MNVVDVIDKRFNPLQVRDKIAKSANPFWDGDGVQGIGQPRDWRGRWVRFRLPGASIFKELKIIQDHNGFSVYRDGKTDKEHLVKTYKTRKGAIDFVERELDKDKKDRRAYRHERELAAEKERIASEQNRYQEQRAQRNQEIIAEGVRSEERNLARPEGRRPARQPQPRDWQGDTPIFRANVSEVDKLPLPGKPTQTQLDEAKKWAREQLVDNSEYKYAGLILRLLGKGITQDPRRRGQIKDKYGISPKRQASIEQALYDHIFPPKTKPTPRKRNLRGIGGMLPSRQKDAMLEQGALRGIPLAEPDSVFEPDRLFKATKGKNKGKWVVVSGKGNSKVVSEKRAANIVRDSHDWWTAHNTQRKEEQERKNRNHREEQLLLLEADNGVRAKAKENKIREAQKWAEENGLDKYDSYWWSVYWNDPSLISAATEEGLQTDFGFNGLFWKLAGEDMDEYLKYAQDKLTNNPINVGVPDVDPHQKTDPSLLEDILSLPDIDARDMRGHKPRGKKALKGDEDFIPATPEQRAVSPEQESRNREREIRHQRRLDRQAYREYLRRNPRSTMKFETYLKRVKNGRIKKSKNPLWDGDGVQGIGQPRNRRGRWTDTGGSLRSAAESMGDLGQVMRQRGSTPSRRAGSEKVTAGAKKSAFANGGLAPGIKINRLRWGPHVMEDKNGKPLQSKPMTPEQALYRRNVGSTALSNADLKRIWENYITKDKLPPKREYDLIVSAGGQLHIDGDTQNIHTRLKSGSKVAKSRGELITMIRSQWSPGSGNRSFKRPDISDEARKRMAAKRRASKKFNSATQAKKREMLAEIFSYDGIHSVCIFCGEPVLNKAMSLETVKPKSEGGEYTIAHMVPSHKSCNTDANADVLNDPKKYWADQKKKYMRMYSASVRKKHRAAGGEI